MNERTLLDLLHSGLRPAYQVDCELGRGGMAAVFLAADTKHDRPVAIKVILPAVAEQLGTERFLHEVRVTARLNHPNLLPLLDSGEVEGLPFYVAPYIAGDDLRVTLMRRGRMEAEEAIEIVTQAGRGLGYAHESEVVHRDVKPGNILLSDGVAVVADFGIARALELSGGDRLTQSGVFLGSPLYMSPEQALGDEPVTGAADQYSLACVLFELLTGSPPFQGASPREVLIRHATRSIPSVQASVPELPAILDTAIRRAMSKRPVDRFPSIREFVLALRN